MLSKGLSKESSPTPQFKSIYTLALSSLYSPTLTSIHDWMDGKTIALTRWTFVGKVMSLLFNMLSMGKVSACNAGDPGLIPGLDWVGKIPWRKKWLPTPVFLRREFHGQKEPSGLQSMRSKY